MRARNGRAQHAAASCRRAACAARVPMHGGDLGWPRSAGTNSPSLQASSLRNTGVSKRPAGEPRPFLPLLLQRFEPLLSLPVLALSCCWALPAFLHAPCRQLRPDRPMAPTALLRLPCALLLLAAAVAAGSSSSGEGGWQKGREFTGGGGCNGADQQRCRRTLPLAAAALPAAASAASHSACKQMPP